MSGIDIESLAWDKQDGLLPAIVQDAATGAVTVTPGETTVVVTGTV